MPRYRSKVSAAQLKSSMKSERAVQVKGTLTALDDLARIFDGYVLECPDPGPEFTHVVIRSHDSFAYHRLLKTVSLGPFCLVYLRHSGLIGHPRRIKRGNQND